jgi:hypothetical protein
MNQDDLYNEKVRIFKEFLQEDVALIDVVQYKFVCIQDRQDDRPKTEAVASEHEPRS